VNKIEAIIRPEKLTSVRSALNNAGFQGMTTTNILGQGDNPGATRTSGRGTGSYVDLTLSKIKLEIVVSDEDSNKVIDLIVDSAATGNPGDGRIFVSPISNTVRIDTAERGAKSL